MQPDGYACRNANACLSRESSKSLANSCLNTSAYHLEESSDASPAIASHRAQTEGVEVGEGIAVGVGVEVEPSVYAERVGGKKAPQDRRIETMAGEVQGCEL